VKKLSSSVWSDFPALDLVRSSRTVRRIGRITFAGMILGFASLVFVPWRQTSPGTGTVLAKDPQERAQPFKSRMKGIVKEVRADLREGSYVQEGEILLELEPAAEGELVQIDFQLLTVQNKAELARSKIAFAEEQIQLQADSGERMKESLVKELESAATKLQQARSELAGAESVLVAKSNSQKIDQAVFSKGLISREQLVNSTQDEETQKQKVAKAKQAVDEAEANFQAKRKEIESKQNDIEIKNRESQNKKIAEEKELQNALKEISDLEVKRQGFGQLTIRAPRNGYIQQWYGIEGSDTVKEGDQLFVLVPDTKELAVEMIISGNDMPLIQVGDKCRLQFEGWPAVQFVQGWPSAAIGTFGAQVNRIFPIDDGNGNFKLLLTPDKHLEQDLDWPENLRQGVRTTGWVLLREVRLGYELWRKINGFPPAKNYSEGDEDSKKSKFKLPKL
jgi:multidrug resistance efflux pump